MTLDDRVLPYFPDEAPAEPSDNLKAMRVSDLLSMSTGHQAEAPFGGEDLVDPVLPGPARAFTSRGRSSCTTRPRATCSRPSSRRRPAPTVARLPAPAPLRAPGHREPGVGEQPAGSVDRRLRPERPHRGHRPLRPALPPEGDVAGRAPRARRLGRRPPRRARSRTAATRTATGSRGTATSSGGAGTARFEATGRSASSAS